MSKLCGVISLGRDYPTHLCWNLCNAMMEKYASHLHEKAYEAKVLTCGKAAFGLLAMGKDNPSLRSLRNFRQSGMVALSGRFFSHLKSSALQPMSYPDLKEDAGLESLVKRYAKYGDQVFTEVEGIFSFALWDSKTGSLTLVNDKLGLSPLYVAANHHLILFASEAEAIAKVAPFTKEPDNEAIAEFFALGQVLKGKTFYSHIKNLPPATIKSFVGGSVRENSYYTFKPKEPSSSDEGELIDNVFETFVDAVSCRAQDRCAKIRLSGGLDSRFILGALLRLGRKVIAETYFLESSDREVDPAYAQILADHCDIKLNLRQKRQHSTLRERIRGITKSQHLTFNGIFGGEILGGMALDITKVDLSAPDSIINDVFTTEFISEVSQTPSFVVREIIADIPLAQPDAKRLYYYFVNSSRSFLSIEQGIGWERPTFFFVGDGLYPFIDVSFLELVFSIPWRLTKGRNFYVRLLQKKIPDIMRVPWMSKPGDVIVYSKTASGALINYKTLERKRHKSEYLECAAEILSNKCKHFSSVYKNVDVLGRSDSPLFERFIHFELWNEIYGPLY